MKTKIKPTKAWAWVNVSGYIAFDSLYPERRYSLEWESENMPVGNDGSVRPVTITAAPTKSQRGKGRKGA